MAAYTKAWLMPCERGVIGIAYERDDGWEGCIMLRDQDHPGLPELIRLLSPSERRKVKEKMNNVVPFPSSRSAARPRG